MISFLPVARGRLQSWPVVKEVLFAIKSSQLLVVEAEVRCSSLSRADGTIKKIVRERRGSPGTFVAETFIEMESFIDLYALINMPVGEHH